MFQDEANLVDNLEDLVWNQCSLVLSQPKFQLHWGVLVIQNIKLIFKGIVDDNAH